MGGGGGAGGGDWASRGGESGAGVVRCSGRLPQVQGPGKRRIGSGARERVRTTAGELQAGALTVEAECGGQGPDVRKKIPSLARDQRAVGTHTGKCQLSP